jgi:hypothetical protein
MVASAIRDVAAVALRRLDEARFITGPRTYVDGGGITNWRVSPSHPQA